LTCSKQLRKDAIELVKQGSSYSSIAWKLNISSATITRWCEEDCQEKVEPDHSNDEFMRKIAETPATPVKSLHLRKNKKEKSSLMVVHELVDDIQERI
jgi:transposase-like protein